MITRKVFRPHICLRCRVAHAQRLISASQFRHASNSSTTTSHKYKPATREELEHDNYRNRIGRRERHARDTGAFGKLYGHHGHSRQEQLEDLKTSSLDKPAKAIVLRDTILNFYTYDKNILKPQLAEHIDIEQRLNEERGLVRQDEVNENISSLKPKPGLEPSSWDEINHLVRELQDGFTTPQLQFYIKKNTQEPDASELEWEENIKGASILRITPWLPGTSEIEHTFDADPLRGYFLNSHTAKQRIILHLLRDCWSIELPELAEGIGQFEIEVEAEDLDLLLLGPNSALDAICSRDLTLDDEKMEVFRPRNVLRITTTRNKRRWIITEIEQALSSVSRYRIDLRVISKSWNEIDQRLDDFMLRELSQLTNCSIKKTAGRYIDVSFLGDKSSTRSSKIDDVNRLLLSLFKDAPVRVQQQLAHAMPNTSITALVKCPPALTSSLPWFHRNRGWSRWAAPIGTLNNTETTPARNSSAGKLVGDIEAPVPPIAISAPSISAKGETSTSDAALVWNNRYFTETSALIGVVLHRDLNSENPNSWSPKSKTEPMNNNYTFSTHIPNLTKTLSTEDVSLHQAPKSNDRLVLRFMPNPFFIPTNPRMTKKKNKPLSLGPDAFSAFPPVEMRFDIDDATKQSKLKDIRAIVREAKTDMMLPENLVDIRFEQNTVSRLKRRYLKQVDEYIKNSRLSLAGGAFHALPTIKLPLSNHLIQEPGIEILGASSHENEDNREVEYLFAGLEIRSTLVYNWKGWLVEYTSVRAGKSGGRRSELRIRPKKNGNRVGEEEFVKQAYLLADLMGGGNSSTAADFVPRMSRHKIRRVQGDAPSLVRQIQTKKGPVQPRFQYFNRYVGISTGPGEESDGILDGGMNNKTRWENSANILDEGDDEEYVDFDYDHQQEGEKDEVAQDIQLEKLSSSGDVGPEPVVESATGVENSNLYTSPGADMESDEVDNNTQDLLGEQARADNSEKAKSAVDIKSDVDVGSKSS